MTRHSRRVLFLQSVRESDPSSIETDLFYMVAFFAATFVNGQLHRQNTAAAVQLGELSLSNMIWAPVFFTDPSIGSRRFIAVIQSRQSMTSDSMHATRVELTIEPDRAKRPERMRDIV